MKNKTVIGSNGEDLTADEHAIPDDLVGAEADFVAEEGKDPIIQEEAETDEVPQEEVAGTFARYRNYWEFTFFLVVAFLIAAALGFFGFLAFKKLVFKDQGTVSIRDLSAESAPAEASPEKTAVEAETEPEKPIQSESNYKTTKILVLNGGAAAGSAGKAKALLAGKGYSQVEAGNAEGSSYSGTVVFYQASSKAAAEKILADLKSDYPKVEMKAAVSSEEKSAPIVIILGK